MWGIPREPICAADELIFARYRRSLHPASSLALLRSGLIILIPSKSFSLSVTTTQSWAPATAATIISSPLRGRPATLPSAINLAQISAALSSNDSTRPANRACGPSVPLNHASRTSRFLPRGFSRIPRRISATVSEAMNRSSSRCSAHQASSDSEGCGLTILLMMLVSRR